MGRFGWTALSVTALMAFVLVMVFRPLPPGIGHALSLSVQTATVLAVCLTLGVRARAASGALRRARLLLCSSLVFATLGGVLALVVRLTTDGSPPVPSVADVVHFLFLPLCVGGLLSYPFSDEVPGSRAQMLLDGLIAAGALWFLTYTLLLAPVHPVARLPVATTVTMLAYPVSDVFLIGMATGVLPRVAPRVRRELALGSLGLTLYAASDIMYAALSARNAYRPDGWVAALAEVGLAFLLMAACQREDRTPGRVTWVRWAAIVPYASVVVALTFAGTLAVLRDGLGTIEVLLLAAMGVTLLLRQHVGNRDRNDATRRLQESRVLFRSLVLGSSDLMTLHGEDGQLRYASPAVTRLTGMAPGDLVAVDVVELVHRDDMSAVREFFGELRRTRTVDRELLLRIRAGDGTWRWCQTAGRNLLDDPDVHGIVCNTRDVHDRHLLQQQIHHDARHDPLTQLGNLAQARELLAAACAGADSGAAAVVALVDLDGFKQVNDTFGHAEGDTVLVAVADRLRGCVRANDSVTRIGGDEFLLLLRGDGGAQAVVESILDKLQTPLRVGGRTVCIGASIGLAHVGATIPPEGLLRRADLAMYAAKAAGRNRYTWFAPGMQQPPRSTPSRADPVESPCHGHPAGAPPQGEHLTVQSVVAGE